MLDLWLLFNQSSSLPPPPSKVQPHYHHQRTQCDPQPNLLVPLQLVLIKVAFILDKHISPQPPTLLSRPFQGQEALQVLEHALLFVHAGIVELDPEAHGAEDVPAGVREGGGVAGLLVRI